MPGAWSSWRARMASPSGFVSIGLVVSLLVGAAAVAVGQGASRVLLELGDGASWLPTDPRGTVTLVDGSSGRPTAEVRLASGDGSSLTVVERAGQVFVLDTATGVLTRIDASTFEAPKAVGTPGSASAVLPADDAVFVVDAEAGVVRVLDALSLGPVGEPIDLGGPIASAVTDKHGLMYALVGDGRLWVLDRGGLRMNVQAAEPGSGATLSVVAGVAHLTDPSRALVTVVGPEGLERSTDVPGLSAAGRVLTPEQVHGRYLAYLVPGDRVLTLDTRSGRVSTAKLPRVPGASWAAPVVGGDLLYVPDARSGVLYVLEMDGGAVRSRVQVTEGGGPFQLSQDSGMVFANDPTTNRAIAIDDSGVAREVSKYDAEVAALAKEPEETPEKLPPAPKAPPARSEKPPAPKDQPRDARPDQPKSPDRPGPQDRGAPKAPEPPVGVPNPGTGRPGGPPASPPAPAPDPVAPGAPSITALRTGDRSVTVEFAPAVAGGEVEAYRLRVTLAGAAASATVREQGRTTFEASFEACGTYEFVVVAIGPGGEVASAPQSAPACVEAGAVRNLSAAARGQDTVTASWQPPAGGTAPFTYRVRLDDAAWQDVDTAQASLPAAPGRHTVTVVAVGADGTPGPATTSAPVEVLATAGAVRGLKATAASHTAVTATWSEPASGTGPFAYEARVSNGTWKAARSGGQITGLQASTQYVVQVRATGKDGKPGPVSETTVTTQAPPKPKARTIVECRDTKQLPGGAYRMYYGTSCTQGVRTGRSFTVLSADYAGYVPLHRYERFRDVGRGYMPEYYLKTGGAPDGGWSGGTVIGHVVPPEGSGPAIKAHRWDYTDDTGYSWKAWSFGTGWTSYQPALGSDVQGRISASTVFRAE